MVNKTRIIEDYCGRDEYIMVAKEVDGSLSVWQSSDDIVFSDILTEKKFAKLSDDCNIHYRGDNFETLDLIAKEGSYISMPEKEFWSNVNLSLLDKDRLFDFNIDIVVCPNLEESVFLSKDCIHFLAIDLLKGINT